MQGVTLSQVRQLTPSPQALRLRSLENSLYLVEVQVGDEWHSVRDEQNQCLRFRSQIDAKKPFRGMGISRAYLCHHSAYDEMIGQPGGDLDNELMVPIADPDHDH
ncbi:DUF6482 family protein [Pokkaliibacter sp. MBI-7]|uniref:DUF6482 family protein n=1 Tax=Pokkaliibacter sp. MBI-7 TaxID=3040600 RepID=UPI00244D753D|nr:DUF6482 family protein [Pokkaliibacter sp. MBI-7]MDH2431460.1 DUF6482 family protein [Pokkaliibacter sp. MBI-7]